MGQRTSAQLEERYHVQKVKLGEGSFASVWRGVDRQNGSVVAIKHMEKRRLRSLTPVKREISILQACKNKNIIGLHETFEDEACIFIVLEYCDGGDFGDKVSERGLELTEGEAADWVSQMCSAVEALHSRDVCHRDIKPDNFMVSLAGSPGSILLKLSDMGLAISLPRGHLLTEKCGTAVFMAPEQHLLPHSLGYGLPADIWATGVSMYMVMFGGRPPFFNSLGQLDHKLIMDAHVDFTEAVATGILGMDTGLRFSDEARRLCSFMLQREPGHRPPATDVAGMSSAWFANTGLARQTSVTSVTPSRGSFSSFGSWPEAGADLFAHSFLSPVVPPSTPIPAVQVKAHSNELLKVQAENHAFLKRCSQTQEQNQILQERCNQFTGENQALLERCNQAEARASARDEQLLKMTSLCEQLQEAANRSKYEAPNIQLFVEAEGERPQEPTDLSEGERAREPTDRSDIFFQDEPMELHEALCQDLQRQLVVVEAEVQAQEHRAERAEAEVADMAERLELAKAQSQQLSAQCEELHESLSAKAAELTKRRRRSFFACLRLSGQRKS